MKTNATTTQKHITKKNKTQNTNTNNNFEKQNKNIYHTKNKN